MDIGTERQTLERCINLKNFILTLSLTEAKETNKFGLLRKRYL